MKVSLFLIILLQLVSCVPVQEVSVYSDGTGTVKSFVPYNELEVREKTRSPLISELKFVNSIEYSYSIQSVDSLGRFLSGIPDELLELRTDGDSILQIISCELKSKPEGYPKFIRFTFYFEKLVDRVENNSYSKVWWDEKRQGNQVDFNIFPEKLWKKRGELEIVVKLKG